MSARLHVQTVLDRLEADPALAGNIIDAHDEGIAERVPPYVVVFSNTGAPEHERQTQTIANRRDYEYDIHTVGVNGTQARAWADRVVAQLEGFRAIVPGWKPAALKHTGSASVSPETDLSAPMIYASNSFRQTSRRSN